MIYLHFVRHGETIFNVYHRMQGWCDTPLTERGRKQAEDIAIGLSEFSFNKVYSSDSGRAMQTAEIIAKQKGIAVTPVEGFREMFFGTMEGLDTQIGHYKEKEYRDTHGWIDVGGENLALLEKRMLDSVQDILSKVTTEDKHLIIVSHGLAIMAMVHYVDKTFFHCLQDYGSTLENASVTTITYENGCFKINDFNNMLYLKIGGARRNEENY